MITGKLDVREAAARLPDELGAQESADLGSADLGDPEAIDILDALPEPAAEEA